MNDFVHSFGEVLVSQICWHVIMNASDIASPPCVISSAGTLSTPGGFVSSAFGLPLLLFGEWGYQHFYFEAVFGGCYHLYSVRSCRVLRITRSIFRSFAFFVKRGAVFVFDV